MDINKLSYKKENYNITWAIQYKKERKYGIYDIQHWFMLFLSLKDHTGHNFTMNLRTVMVDILISLKRELTTKWTTMEAITRKKGNPHIIINTMLYYTCIMKESKNVKSVILSATAAIKCASQIKGWYMSMNSSFASAPHFCLQSTPRKDTMKVECRPYHSNYAEKTRTWISWQCND